MNKTNEQTYNETGVKPNFEVTHLTTHDGYTFTPQAGGEWGDGDITFDSFEHMITCLNKDGISYSYGNDKSVMTATLREAFTFIQCMYQSRGVEALELLNKHGAETIADIQECLRKYAKE